MNLQNLYRATKKQKMINAAIKHLEIFKQKNTEKHLGSLKKKSSKNNPLPNKCLNQNYPPQTPFWQLS